MPRAKVIVTSQGTFIGLRALGAFVGAKPENLKKLVREGRVEELLSGLFKGFDFRRLGIANLRVARSTITRRLAAFTNIEQVLKQHLGAVLLTTRDEYVYATGSTANHVRVACGVPSHPTWTPLTEVVLRDGWCGHCRASVRKTPDAVRFDLRARGFELLSEYANANAPLKLRCANGHLCRISLSKLTNCGYGCPRCSGSREEAAVRYYLEAALGIRFALVRTRPEWLVGEHGHRLELDGLSLEDRLAFEYQGEHHYRDVGYGGTRRPEVSEIMRRDRLKLEACDVEGIRLVVVPMLPKNWSDAEARAHVLAVLTGYFPGRAGDFAARLANASTFVRKDAAKLSWFRAECERRGWRLNESEWHGYARPHSVTCERGHTWAPTPGTVLRKHRSGTKIFRGHGCPVCGHERTSAAVGKAQRKRFEAAREARYVRLRMLVEAGGNIFEEQTYHGSGKPHRVRCGTCDHSWSTTAGSLIQGHGCPACWLRRRAVAFTTGVVRKREKRQERLARAAEMFHAGASLSDVASALAVTLAGARQYRAELGLGPGVSGVAPRRRADAEEREKKALALYRSGAADADVATALDVSLATARAYRRRGGLGLRERAIALLTRPRSLGELAASLHVTRGQVAAALQRAAVTRACCDDEPWYSSCATAVTDDVNATAPAPLADATERRVG